mgnify:CR=1 FL=1
MGWGWLFLSFSSVLLFCFSARQFAAVVISKSDYVRLQEFSARALRIEKKYKIFAWSVLTGFLFYSMLHSFLMTFEQIVY